MRRRVIAWVIFLWCLAAFVGACRGLPPWNQLDRPEGVDWLSASAVLGLPFGSVLLLLMAVCLWWILPPIFQWLGDFIVEGMEEEKAAAEYRKALLEEQWHETIRALETNKTLPDQEWLAVSESFKDALLDQTSGPERKLEGLPRESWAALDAHDFARVVRPSLDDLLARLAVLINERHASTDQLMNDPRVRQLLKDFEHELLELAEEHRIATTFARLPAPHGEWAQRYRHMIETETRTSQHHGPNPSHN